MHSWSYATVLAMGLFLSAQADAPYVYENKELGVKLSLPNADWKLNDHSQGIAKVLVFTPVADMSTRCTLLYMPAAALPEGILSREAQIKGAAGDRYKRIAYTADKLGGKAVDRGE